MNYYYPPPRRRSSKRVWTLVGVMVVVAVVSLAVLGAVLTSRSSGPRYSTDEQQFLTDVHAAQPSEALQQSTAATGPWSAWPSDAELVGEGHQICKILAETGGNREPVEMPMPFGKPVMPSFMPNYSMDQRNELVHLAVKDLCVQFALWVGGVPI